MMPEQSVAPAQALTTSKDLAKVKTALTGMDKIKAGLTELQQRYGGVVFDVRESEGMREAKEARAAIREPRFQVERIRKEAKAPILALGKALDTTAAAITAAVMKIETPIVQQIETEEKRIADEKAEAIKREADRVAAIHAKLDRMRNLPPRCVRMSSVEIQAQIELLRAATVTRADFAEFEQQGDLAHIEALELMRDLYAAAQQREAAVVEAQRIADEQAERDRIAQAARDAELKAERERLAEQQRQIDADRKKLADAQAELVRQQQQIADDAAAATQRIVDEQNTAQRLEAIGGPRVGRPSAESIIESVCADFTATRALVLSWMREIDWDCVKEEV